MNRIQKVSESRKAFIPFMTAGDPNLSVMEKLAPVMAEMGADLIGIDIPFSNPVTEGIVIWETDMCALASGTTTGKIFDSVRRIRLKIGALLVFMIYINPIFVHGVDKFMKQVADCGIGALIVPDMSLEKRQESLPICRQYGLVSTYLVAPISREWAQAITRESEGLVCCVSPLGVTGVRKEVTTSIKEMVETVKQGKNVSCAIGLDISTPEQATKMAARPDGVIVGSAITKIVTEYGTLCVKPVCDYVHEMEQAAGAQKVIKRKRSVSGE